MIAFRHADFPSTQDACRPGSTRALGASVGGKGSGAQDPPRAAGGSADSGSGRLAIEPVDPLGGSAWDREIRAFPEANFFHSSAWARVLQATYGHRPCYYRFVRDGRTVALAPLMEVRSRLTGNRGVALPFSDLCGPLLAAGEDPGAVTAFLVGLARRRHWKYLEIRGIGLPEDVEPSVRYLGHRLDLRPGAETLWTHSSGAARRGVRRARAEGLTASVDRDTAAVSAFYDLHLRTRRLHGLPPQPRAFFRHFQREILEPGRGSIVIVRAAGRPVAAAVFVQSAGTALYKFGASDPRSLHLRPNNLALWTGIESAAAAGATALDFGRTSLDNSGLRRFKLGWGADEFPIFYARHQVTSGRWVGQADATSGAHTRLFRRLPLIANRLAGTVLYPHLS